MILSLTHPARHYIYYLISRKTYKLKDLVEHLSSLHIPLPQDRRALEKFIQQLLFIQKNMKIPGGFNPLDSQPNENTKKFLAEWKIGSMWRRDPFTDYATDMVHEAPIRRSLEVLLLGPLQPIDIARRVASRWGFDETVMNPRVVRDFSHYFWDPKCMNASQWKAFFYDYYPKFTDNVDYAMAINVSRTREGALLVMSLSDRGADGLSNSELYSMMRNASGLAFLQHAYLERPSAGRATAMLATINSFKIATEELDKARGGSQELLEELRKMEPVYDKTPVISVYDLTVSKPTPALPDNTIEHEPVEVPDDRDDDEGD